MKRLQLAARQAWVRFQRWRYRLLARWLGVAPTGGGAEPCVVFCQIDGLGAQRLEAALRAGYLPFLRQLIERHGYQAQRWRCGVPADTPPVQGALLYGRNDQIPGFYWLDKRTGRWQSCLNPLHAALVEERLNHRGAALLADGSSYANMFAGGATRTLFTTSTAFHEPLAGRRHLAALLTFLALRPGRALRVAADVGAELAAETADRVWAIRSGRPRRPEGPFPLVRVLVTVLLRELTVTAARLDLTLGVPALYVNFVGYDLVGHHSGPDSPNALATLRGIDRAIRRIAEARAWAPRPYELIVLSDHGLTPSRPFEQLAGRPFARFVAELAGAPPDDARPVGGAAEQRYLFRSLPYLRLLMLRADELEPLGEKRRVRLLGRLGRWLNRGALDWEDASVAVTVGGSLAHVYFRERAERLTLEQIERLRPGLVRRLLEHPGVGLIIVRSRGNLLALGRSGRRWLTGPQVVPGDDPLEVYEEIRKPSALKAAGIVVNVLVVCYLALRLRRRVAAGG